MDLSWLGYDPNLLQVFLRIEIGCVSGVSLAAKSWVIAALALGTLLIFVFQMVDLVKALLRSAFNCGELFSQLWTEFLLDEGHWMSINAATPSSIPLIASQLLHRIVILLHWGLAQTALSMPRLLALRFKILLKRLDVWNVIVIGALCAWANHPRYGMSMPFYLLACEGTLSLCSLIVLSF